VAESLHDQIGAALEAALRGIAAGATYHYTPDAVLGIEWYDGLLNSGLRTIYAVRITGDETHAEESSNEGMRAVAEVFILLLQKYEATLDPFDQPVLTRRRVVDRMVQDAITALLQDVQLGGLVENVFGEPAIVERERWTELAGWAVAEIRLGIAYTYSGRP
jgi:hypothetical protein